MLAAAGLAACGSGDPASKTVFAGAARSTTAARSARVGIDGRISDDSDPTFDEVTTGEGVFDFARRRGRLTYSDTYSGSEGVPSTLIVVGDTIYLDSALVNRLDDSDQAQSRPWVSIARSDDRSSSTAAELFEAPTEALRHLETAAGPVSKIGTETVRGERTTHYHGTLRPSAESTSTAAVDPPEKRTSKPRIKPTPQPTSAASDEDPVSIDVWIDGRDRVRRIRTRQALPTGRSGYGSPETSEYTYELWDFGVVVDVSPPPPDQVRTLKDEDQPAGTTTTR